MVKNNEPIPTEITDDVEVIENPIKAILRNMGQPTKYTPDACIKIIEVAANGGHTAAMILAAGAKSRTTYYAWQEEYPEFKEAVELAKLVSQAYYEDPAVIRSLPSTAWAIIVNNKFSHEYNRNIGTGTSNTNINFNTVNLSETQKLDRIKGLLEKLNTAGKDLGDVYDADSGD